LAVAGGVVAAGALVAAVAGGGGDEPSCSARDIVGQIPADSGVVVVDDQTICSQQFAACSGGRTLRSCVSGICTNNCTAYYELSDGRRFSCGPLANCLQPSGAISDPTTFCLAAAQQVVQACQ